MINRTIGDRKKAEIVMKISEFEMPPMQDALIIGKQAPIGPEAARRMVDILSPDQYVIIRVDHPIIEAIVIRKPLLTMLPQEKLVSLILEEGGCIANETMIVKAQIGITLQVSKSIDL
ncbi:hypothetical protein SAMN05446037_102245 [Anaerovirgula multivorans]|uniref:Uncharacterized protein n=1 Tax=Anaerovirgula multivorans TaxID=312168 RepID=A0A239HLE8_9FIRM|nr:hypothetical protein [Anaerovirgula multivorans]SNS81673.1 hypothetical protein SAMN05446037_102245 [Anaerovirgula multivorans]